MKSIVLLPFNIVTQRSAPGWVTGLNNLVVNPKYGPRVRYNSIITEAELSATPLLEEETCLGSSCAKCLEGCPGKAIAGANIPLKTLALTIISSADPVSKYKSPSLHKKPGKFLLSGRCLAVCPVGMEVLD